MSIEEIKNKVIPILRKGGVNKASIFGSVARGEERQDSDVDILIEIPKPYGLFEFVEIKHNLEDALNRKVDLVDYKAIKPRIKDNVLKNQIKIL